jgi:short subunit dehydrogenase-like uncharacterized protein
MASRSGRTYDVLVYGATGFTGRLAARYLAQHAPAGLAWGIAGRDAGKLAAVAAELRQLNPALAASEGKAGGFGLVVADAASIRNVTRATRVVLTTVGPFLLHGEPLVAACVADGTDYIDSTGEAIWVQDCITKYGAEARAKGVTLVSMCGFDSIPADLGTFFTVDHIRRTLGVRTAAVTGYVTMRGGASGGTIASVLNLLNSGRSRESTNPFLLVPAAGAGGPPPAALVQPVSDMAGVFWAREVRKWAHYFVMSGVNTRVVRRSAALAALEGDALVAAGGDAAVGAAAATPAPVDGRSVLAYSAGPFAYSEYQTAGGFLTALARVIGLALGVVSILLPGLRSLVRRMVPQPGTGPSDAVRARGYFAYTMVGRTEEAVPRTVITQVRGGEPGYTETSKMLCEAALALALQRPQLPATALGGGFLTPAAAFGGVLVRRLHAAGITFEVLDGGAGGGAAAAGGAGAGLASPLLASAGSEGGAAGGSAPSSAKGKKKH